MNNEITIDGVVYVRKDKCSCPIVKNKDNDKKYGFTGETTVYNGHTLHRIIALKDFDEIEKGDIGGWIEDEKNLSHKGECWVSDNAYIYDNACVCGNARVYDDALVCDNACIRDNARVYDDACVRDNACVCGNARVCDFARVFGKTRVRGKSCICGCEKIYEGVID